VFSRRSVSRSDVFRLVPVVFLLVCAAALMSTTRPAYSPGEKAFYADPATVAFVRPGLVFDVTAATVAADGTVSARFKITDPPAAFRRAGAFIRPTLPA
jgi:hypothetical protein